MTDQEALDVLHEMRSRAFYGNGSHAERVMAAIDHARVALEPKVAVSNILMVLRNRLREWSTQEPPNIQRSLELVDLIAVFENWEIPREPSKEPSVLSGSQ